MGALTALTKEYWPQALLLLAGLLLGWLLQGWRLGADVAEARQELAAYRAEVARKAAMAEAAAREEEQRRQKEIEEIRDAARGELERASADARAADELAVGLQREVDRLRRSRSATCDTIAAQRSQAAESVVDVLADLLVEVERAGREMAAEADRRGIAGRACEAAYDALR